MPASRLRGTLQVLLWCCARRARCAITQTEMPVLSSVSACLSAMQNLSKKSLILLSDVDAESRKRQVLPAPRTPNAKRDHLSLMQRNETVTSIAPLTRKCIGWDLLSQLDRKSVV